MKFETTNFFLFKVLTTQLRPISSSTSIYTNCNSDVSEEKKFVNEIKEMKDVIKKLEGEKSKLEYKLSTINEKHDNEITFQAEFYEYVY